MAMYVGGKGKINSEINVTPLVDVVFVLLIIFMVVAPLLERGYDLDVPEEVKQQQPDSRQIVVAFTKNGHYFLNKERTDKEQLPLKLSQILSGQSKKLVFLAAARELNYGDVVELMDAIRASGAASIGLVTDDKLADIPLDEMFGL